MRNTLLALIVLAGCAPQVEPTPEPTPGCPDADGDGFAAQACGGEDCDDTRADIQPFAREECDGLDGNCDGEIHERETYDIDGDGVPHCFDCNPLDPAVGDEEPCPSFWDGIELGGWEALPPLEDLDLEPVLPTPQVPYLELGWRYANIDRYETWARRGEPCVDATDPAACLDALAALDPFVGFSFHCQPGICFNQLYWSRANEVGVVGHEGLAEFLRPIESTQEVALLLAALDIYWFGFDGLESGGVRRVEDGWEAYGLHWAGGPGVRIDLVLVHIGADGTRTELRRFIDSIEWDAAI